MKKITATALLFSLLVWFAGCSLPGIASGPSTSESLSSTLASYDTTDTSGPNTTLEPVLIDFETLSAEVGYHDTDSGLYRCADNAPLVDDNTLPVHSIATLEDMQQFFSDYFPVATLQYPSPLDPFLEIMTEDFFRTKMLVLIYVPSPASESSYGISKIEYVPNCMKLSVQELTVPNGDWVMGGWLLGACIDRTYYTSDNRYMSDLLPYQDSNLPSGVSRVQVNSFRYILEQPSGTYFAPGTVMKFRTQVLIDADIAMYINGQRHSVGKQAEPNDDFWTFSFEMPSEDVIVDFQIECT